MRHRVPLRAALLLPLAPLLAAVSHPSVCRGQAVSAPPGRWIVGGTGLADYDVRVDSAVAHGGRASAHLRARVSEPAGTVILMQSVRADEYRNRRVRLSGYVRTAAVGGGGAALWLRVDGLGTAMGFASPYERARTGSGDWTRMAVELDVPNAAAGIALGAQLDGSGQAWVDDLTLETVGAPRADTIAAPPRLGPPVPPEQVAMLERRFAALPTRPEGLDFEGVALRVSPVRVELEGPRALTPRGLQNVRAFARLYGYVRYFHPSDATLTTNWEEFVVRGMRAVERAPTADSLARTLTALFAATAPTLRVAETAMLATDVAPASTHFSQGAVAVWRHRGVGVGAAPGYSPYASTRVILPTPTGAWPADLPDPRTALRVDLGGGVSAAVPLALWAEPAATPAQATRTPAPAATMMMYSANDRATRLADVAIAWNVMQHFYPYFDVVRTDWPAELDRALAAAAADSAPGAFDRTLKRLVAALHDGHGSVTRLSARLGVPPVTLEMVEGQMVITAVDDSIPRLRPGDVVLAIDGRPAAQALADQEALSSGATPQWVRVRALAQLDMGVPGSATVFRVRAGGEPTAPPRDVQLTRRAGVRPRETHHAVIEELRPGVFYVDIDRLTDSAFIAALPRLERASGIVFDMRGYPRSVSTPAILARLTDTTIRSALFEVPQVTRPDRAGVTFSEGGWPVQPIGPRLRAKVAFVTAGGAISYAETTMGMVEHFKLGEIVGEPTAGTNGNINPFPLPGGYNVVWTGMRVRKHDGSQHHGVGIQPTVPAHRTLRGVAAGRDEMLERAVEVVAPGGAPTP